MLCSILNWLSRIFINCVCLGLKAHRWRCSTGADGNNWKYRHVLRRFIKNLIVCCPPFQFLITYLIELRWFNNNYRYHSFNAIKTFFIHWKHSKHEYNFIQTGRFKVLKMLSNIVIVNYCDSLKEWYRWYLHFMMERYVTRERAEFLYSSTRNKFLLKHYKKWMYSSSPETLRSENLWMTLLCDTNRTQIS